MDLFVNIARSISHAQTAEAADFIPGDTGVAVCLLLGLILLLFGLILLSFYLKRK